MEKITVSFTLLERSMLRELLLKRTGELSEAIYQAERKDCNAIAEKLTEKRNAFTDILAKL